MPHNKATLPLTKLPTGERVFIDSNIFIYHFTGLSQQCSGFLERCERGELWGVTAVHIVLEVLHRLMMIEAVTKTLVTPGNIAKKLRKRLDVVKQLADYQIQTEAILEMDIEVVGLTSGFLKVSYPYRRRDGLLVNDSLTTALMEAEGILDLATANLDFGRVEALRVYSPTDLTEG